MILMYDKQRKYIQYDYKISAKSKTAIETLQKKKNK